MMELSEEFFAMLRLTKSLYDNGLADQLKRWYGFCPLDADDYWEIAHESIGWVFRDTRGYYNEEAEIETWLFIDPVIDRFCSLCQEYEHRKGIPQKENLYRRDMEQIVHDSFTFNSYSYGYDWRLSEEDRGRKCLLLFLGCEFYSLDEVVGGLLEIKDGFEAMTSYLEDELSKETRIIPLSLVTEVQQKEVA